MTNNNTGDYIEVNVTDYSLLLNPLLNKGTAFTAEERAEFNLFGLLPPERSTMVQQQIRSYEAFKNKHTPLEKYIYLRDLQDSNETLYYALLCQHITEIMPIVYTPVVGEACQSFSHIYRRPRGIFIAYPDQDKIDKILSNSRFDNIQVIVVSDGERILGLGDQGAGGMGIPIGKLALYCACSGIHPGSVLPILLDTGTNNTALIKDPLYIGWRHERIRGKEYDDFIEVFIQAIKKRFPHVVLQWEDFAIQNATRLLNQYQHQLCTFNDDIQGTAAVVTGTLLAAMQITGIPLVEQYIVIAGAGSAGCGIADLIVKLMMGEGLTEKAACNHIFMVDKEGLLLEGINNLLPFQKKYAKSLDSIAHWVYQGSATISLQEVITNLHPHALLGVSGQAGLFQESLIKEMAAHQNHPIIMPLSNPPTHSEALPTDLVTWTQDKALISTGSPFPDIFRNGKLTRVDQTNNVYIFPGMGLGLLAIQATKVTDNMLIAAAKALASCSPAQFNLHDNLLPPLSHIREISYKIAFAVAQEAVNSGLAPYLKAYEIEKCLQKHIWKPEYKPYKLKK